MKKQSVIIGLLFCSVITFCACKKDEESKNIAPAIPEQEEAAEYQPYLEALRPQAYSQVTGLNLEPGTYISMIGRAVNTAYWDDVKAGAEQAAADINSLLGYKGEDKIKVNYSGPSERDNVDEQINILDEELARYPAAVGIAIIDSQACAVQFDLAAENGIPIVAFDSGSDYSGIVSMSGMNNAEAAQTAATKLCSSIGDKGEIFLVIHDSKSTTGKQREAAAVEEITANHKDVTIVQTIHLDSMQELYKTVAAEKNSKLTPGASPLDPDTLKDEDVFQYYFEKYPNVKGALATNVDATRAIVTAKDQLEKQPEKFQLIGFDGGEEQMADLKNGKINGLIVQNPFGMGYSTVVATARAVLNQGNEAFIDCGYLWVTKDNMDTENIKKML